MNRYLVAAGIGTIVSSGVFAEGFSSFKTAKEAEAFGWRPRVNCTLTAGKGPDGSGSVVITAQKGAKKYSGVTLFQKFPFSQATPKDYISCKVRQNFGTGIYLNFATTKGSVYENIKLQRDKWNDIKLSLDFSKWKKPKKNKSANWADARSVAFYAYGFSKPGTYLEIADLEFTIGGKKYIPQRLGAKVSGDIRKLKDSTKYKYLKTDYGIWAIDLKTGMTAGVWNRKNGEQYISHLYSKYFVMNLKKEYSTTEKKDQVFSSGSHNNVFTMNCRNDDLPGITIVKTFRVEGPRLYRKLEFLDKGGKTIQFVTVRNEVTFQPEYRKDSYHLGAGYIGPLTPVETLYEPRRVTRFRQMTKGMVLSNSRKNYSFSNYRLFVNNRLCYPWWQSGISGYAERDNCLYYTPRGWDMPLGTLRLLPNSKFTITDVQTVFPGTWYDFMAKIYPETPAVKADLEKIPEVPDWLSNVYCCLNMESKERLRKIAAMSDSGYIMVIICPTAGWGDYYVDQGSHGSFGGWITGPELKKTIADIKAIAPDRVKVGIYNLSSSATWESRIFKKHPEWFRSKDKYGNKQLLFPGCADNWASMIDNKDCYNELLKQYGLQLDYLGVDFIYLDESKTHNIIKWDTQECTTDADWYSYWRDMQKIIKKRGADKAVWFNGRGNPYGDVNFMEARNQLRYGFWRQCVGMGLGMETWLKNRPKARLIPLYWHKSVDDCYINRVLALGWIPSLTYGDPETKRPFATATLEMGNSNPIDTKYTPDWKSDPETKLESYVMKRMNGEDVVMSLISHEEKTKTFTINIDVSTLELEAGKGKPLNIWYYTIKKPNEFAKGCLTEKEVKELYRMTGKRTDLISEPEVPRKCNFDGEQLTLELKLQPQTLYQLVFSRIPGGIYSIDDLPATWYFTGQKQLQLTSGLAADKKLKITGVNRARKAEIMLFFNASDLRVNGKSARVRLTNEKDRILQVVTVPRGRFEITGNLIKKGNFAQVKPNRVAGGKSRLLTAIKPAEVHQEVLKSRSVTKQLDGAKITAEAINISRWRDHQGLQPGLPPFIAKTDANNLTLQAGTSRKICDFIGFSFAGFMVENLRKVKLQLDNTFFNAVSLRSRVFHLHPYKKSSRYFAGFMVDYHTPKGWSKRVAFGVGVLHDKLSCAAPRWGHKSKPNQLIDLGPIIEKGYKTTLSLDLAKYAPKDWDGKMWFGVGTDFVAAGRNLTVKFLAANNQVKGPFASGIDPQDFQKRFREARVIKVPRAPMAPLIDGSADDEMWSAAAKTKDFYLVGGKGIPSEDTRIQMFYDDKYLYISAICGETERKTPITGTGSIWRDDEIELYFVPNPKAKPIKFYQLLINAAGEKLELAHKQSVGLRVDLKSQVKAMKRKGAWHIEAAIPFKSLGVTAPKPGDVWLANFCRHRPPGKKTPAQLITWSPVMKGFNEYRKFNKMIFTK